MVLRKYEIEQALHEEKRDIASGRLKEDNPLDLSEGFRLLCEASRRGDLKACQERIAEGVNLNAKDSYDYSPLILVSCPSIIDAKALSAFSDGVTTHPCSYQASNKTRGLITEVLGYRLVSVGIMKWFSICSSLERSANAILSRANDAYTML